MYITAIFCYCSARWDPIHMRMNNKSTPIQHKQARAHGPYPAGRLLTPPQPPLTLELEMP